MSLDEVVNGLIRLNFTQNENIELANGIVFQSKNEKNLPKIHLTLREESNWGYHIVIFPKNYQSDLYFETQNPIKKEEIIPTIKRYFIHINNSKSPYKQNSLSALYE